jgi:hypothetical protein
MPEPFTTVAAGIGIACAIARQGNTVSPEGRELISRVHAVRSAYEDSHALFGPQASLLARLRELAYECGEADWDGYGAEPISEDAAELAADFLRALPPGFPLPDLCAEPDGSLGMEWSSGGFKRAALSFGDSNRLAFAWVDGSDRGHAVVHFDGAILPSLIASRITEVFGNANAAFWAP